MSDVVIPEVFAIFEQKLAHVLSYDLKTEEAEMKVAIVELLEYFMSVIGRTIVAESLVERLIKAGDVFMTLSYSLQSEEMFKRRRDWGTLVAEQKAQK